MTLTLAEFEDRCINGPIGSVLPVDEMAALKLVQELATRYYERIEEHAAHWRPQKAQQPARARDSRGQFKSFAEMSLPSGDKA